MEINSLNKYTFDTEMDDLLKEDKEETAQLCISNYFMNEIFSTRRNIALSNQNH